jgi:hypothetical protein
MLAMLRILPVVVLGASSVAQAASAPPIRLDPFMGRALVVHAAINGHPGVFMFDSGGGVSNITPAFAAQIGCKPWGQISGFQMSGKRLDMQRCDNVTVQIGQHQARRETIGVFDMDKLLPTGSTERVDGTLGLDVFDGSAVRFSYAERTLTVLDEAAVASLSRNSKPMPLHVVRDAEGVALTVNLPIRTERGTAWFEMDSGNTSPYVLVGKHLADLFNLKDDPKAQQTVKAELADGSPIESSTKVLDLTLDGNLGTTFLSQYDVTIDLANQRAWVVPNKSVGTAGSP